MSTDIDVITFEGKPRWKLTVFRDDNGELFAPAAITGNERGAVMTASYDGIKGITAHRHVYLPISWLRRAFPETEEICAVLERRLEQRNPGR
jgi:hypothetical protein